MSDDEVFAFIVSGMVASIALWRFLSPLLQTRLMRPWWGRQAIAASLATGMGVLFFVIECCAAKEVSEDGGYVSLFMVEGLACVLVVVHAMPVVGIRWREDALERRNAGAVLVTCGALLGSSLICAGSNIGEGETIWTTIGPQVFALLEWGWLWVVAQGIGGFAERVTVERDTWSGLRLGTMLLASGLVLGRAVAGNWISLEEMGSTLARQGWPAAAFAVSAGLRERMLPAKSSHLLLDILLPVVAMPAIAVVWVISRGRW